VSTSRRIALALVVALIATSVGAASAFAVAGDPVVVQALSAEAFPRIDLGVTLPADVLASGEEPRFTVTENGESVEVVESKMVEADRGSLDVVLLVDTSGSMKGAPLADAKAAAARFVGAMGAEDRIALVSFSTAPKVLADFTSDKASLTASVDGLAASGDTAVYDALVKASALIGASDASRQAVVLLSDGGDTVSVNDANKALASVKAAGAPVYAVALESSDFNPQFLQVVAKDSAGRYLPVNNSAELEAIYAGIAKELSNQYVVSYTSALPNTKDVDLGVTATAGAHEVSGRLTMPNPRYAEVGFAGEPVEIEVIKPSALLLIGAALFAFVAAALLSVAVGRLVVKDRTRLKTLEFYDQSQGYTGEDAASPTSGPAGLRARMIGAVGEVAGKRGFTKMVHQQLERAGLPLRPAEYIFMHLTVVVGAGFVTQVLTGNLLVSMVVVLVAVLAPMYYLDGRARKRTEAFEAQLPDLLGLLAGSLRAGWGLLQAIGVVVEQMPPPASDEFRRVQTEARLGLPVEEALEKMASRLGSDDFRWTVTAINIQREVGGNLAEVLDIVASTMRARSELRRHINALTAEGKLSGMILVGLPFVVLLALVFVNPRYLQVMVANPLGWVIGGVGFLLLGVGIFWLRAAMKVEI